MLQPRFLEVSGRWAKGLWPVATRSLQKRRGSVPHQWHEEAQRSQEIRHILLHHRYGITLCIIDIYHHHGFS
jgi:hypothetical protein